VRTTWSTQPFEDAPEHLKSLVIASQSDSGKLDILAETDSLTETNTAIEKKLYEGRRIAPDLKPSTSNPKKKHIEVTSPDGGKAVSQDNVTRVVHEPPVAVVGEAIIPAATQDVDGQGLIREALPVTSTGQVTTAIQVRSHLRDAVVATMMIAAVVQAAAQDAIPMTPLMIT